MKSFIALFALIAVASARVLPENFPLIKIVLNINGQDIPIEVPISGPVNPIVAPALPIVAPVQPIVGGAEPIIAPVLPVPGSIIAAPVVADLLAEGSIVDTVAIAEPIAPVAAPAIPDIAIEGIYIPAAPSVPSIVVEGIAQPEAPIGIMPIPESLN